MTAKLFHAHPGGAKFCLLPPQDNWACPYSSQEAADEARPSFIAEAALWAYGALGNLSVEEFSKDGGRPVRLLLAAIAAEASGDQSLLEDAWWMPKPPL